MRKIKLSLLTISLSFFAMSSWAQGSGPNPFSDCGIGAALFPNTAWAAVTSNVIWDVGTTAVTSATASPETCSGNNAQAAQFIHDTYDNLVEETAKGQGEHVAALLNIMECKSNVHNPVMTSVRSDMAKIVADQDYTNKDLVEKASDYYNAFNNALGNYSDSCSA